MNKKIISAIGAVLGWFALIGQFVVMQNNAPTSSTISLTVHFFSYFTILTNTLVALFFTALALPGTEKLKQRISKPGVTTAITGYILVVGLVYQVALRQLWNPQGFAQVVDELLHTIIPAYVLVFWVLFENKQNLQFKSIAKWMIYPLIYVVYTFVRGEFAGTYPYPFVDVTLLGYPSVLMNSALIILFFILIYCLLIGATRLKVFQPKT